MSLRARQGRGEHGGPHHLSLFTKAASLAPFAGSDVDRVVQAGQSTGEGDPTRIAVVEDVTTKPRNGEERVTNCRACWQGTRTPEAKNLELFSGHHVRSWPLRFGTRKTTKIEQLTCGRQRDHERSAES